MSKQVEFARKPVVKTADEWVGGSETKTGKTQSLRDGVAITRLTLEIPTVLHRRMKSACAADGLKMVDVITEMIAQRFGVQ